MYPQLTQQVVSSSSQMSRIINPPQRGQGGAADILIAAIVGATAAGVNVLGSPRFRNSDLWGYHTIRFIIFSKGI
jgi:hypothetical protein